MIRGGAAERVLRTIALLFAIGAVVFGALTTPMIVAQSGVVPLWWTVAGTVAILGSAVGLGVVAPFAPIPALRTLAACVSIGWLCTAASVPFVMPATDTHDQSPWPLALTALGTTATVLVWRPLVAWFGVGAMGLLVLVDRIVTATGDLTVVAIQDAAYAVFFAAVFVGLGLGALRAGRAVDTAAERASGAVVEATVERIRRDERTRVDSLVHDRVLATLLLAGRSLIGQDVAARQADEALMGLRAMTETTAPRTTVPGHELADRLRAEATSIAPFAEVAIEISTDAAALESAVAEAVIGATSEALRNAVAYAGAVASLLVDLRADSSSTEVVVIDDGAGFAPDAVAETRLGIRSSIVGRMRAVGGDADVRSQPGRGTAVRIWVVSAE